MSMRLARFTAAMLLAAACTRGKDAGSGPYAREVAEAIPRIEQSTGHYDEAELQRQLRTGAVRTP